MKLAFYINYLNHHQVLVADELYRLLGENFVFVATYPRCEQDLKGGKDYSDRPYCLLAGESEEARRKAMALLREVDVAFIGGGNLEYEVERAKIGKLAFEVSERWLKRGWLNVLSPLVLKNIFYYHTLFRKKPIYKLCCSAFAASDCAKLGAFRNRCYKWGYFTKVDENADFEKDSATQNPPVFRLMWCARFLKLKHPELPVRMAAILKQKGYSFALDFYGSGAEEAETKRLASRLAVEDVVRFHGSRPNEEILLAMKRHDMFLFTSDRLEGWGAVANESMANGCVLVASDAIGSAPYLVEDGRTGYRFQSGDADSLAAAVQRLLDDPARMRRMQENAYRHMRDQWSPRHAAEALLRLIDDLQAGRETSIAAGPCSRA